MAFHAAIADGVLWRRRMVGSETIAVALAAVTVSLGAAAWITDSNLSVFPSKDLPDRISFADRFSASTPASPAGSVALEPLDRSALAVVEMKLRAAKGLLASQMMSWDSRFAAEARLDGAKIDESKSTAAGAIPLPRSRPAAADLEGRGGPALARADDAARPDDRTLLQKLSDLLPERVTLASLVPDVGLLRRGPDLASLGYDGLTAVYDISAHAVYLPNGLSLEAHSGMGSLRDDPEHVSVPNEGATPPAVYELKPREKAFHGVQALRMIPAEGSDTSGRSGLLVHSFMIGPNGDSNGCVSIKNYDRFLKAFSDGEINRLVVVPSLRDELASRQST